MTYITSIDYQSVNHMMNDFVHWQALEGSEDGFAVMVEHLGRSALDSMNAVYIVNFHELIIIA